MAEITWTNTSLDCMDDIAEYIAVSNPSAASKLVRKIFEKAGRLELFPESGRIVEEAKDMGYREVIVTPCRIIYKLEGDTIFIVHVVRQERDLRRYLLNQPSNDAY